MILTPVARALRQMDDPAFLRVVLASLLWSLACFAGLLAACAWGARSLAAWLAHATGLLAWLASVLGAAGAILLALWLFVPVALVIATLYLDRIAAAVDARFYPFLPSPHGAPILVQAWDGAVLGAQVLLLQLAVFALGFALPGLGWLLGFVLAGWAAGRGLFVAVAMRRMPRQDATALYRARRATVVLGGILLAVTATIPLVNLFIPVLGTAVMVHILNAALPGATLPGATLPGAGPPLPRLGPPAPPRIQRGL